MSDFQRPEESHHKFDWQRDNEARMRDYELNDKLREQEEEEAKKSPYTKRGGFTQFADAELGNLSRLTMENQTAAAIFLFLTRYMSNHNAVACSHSVLMQVTGKSRATVSKAVSVLKEKNYVGIKKPRNKSGISLERQCCLAFLR